MHAEQPPTLAELRAWLGTQPGGRVVGYRRGPVRCPVARMLNATRGDWHSVGGRTIRRHHGGLVAEYVLPFDIMKFTVAVDGSSHRPGITARKALALLTQVEQEATPCR